jgi:cytochrome P450
LFGGRMIDGRRPRFVVMGELYMTDDSILVQGYNDKWRKQRKILHQALVPRAIQKYKPIQDAESKRLLWHLITTPQHFETHLNRYISTQPGTK